MAEHKNQHFVPRAHLRRFSEAGEKSIGLANILTGVRVRGAPIKSQCARPYFYGKDLVVEKSLQPVEGLYDATLREVEEAGTASDQQLDSLLFFSLVQSMRAEVTIKASQASQESMFDLAFERVPHQRPPSMSIEQTARQAISLSISSWPYLSDLSRVLLWNPTKDLFITSDNPVCRFNKFFHRKFGPAESWGTGSAGVCFYMPLNGRMALLAYDESVYRSLGNLKHKLLARDVHLFNEIQYLNCMSNLYYSSDVSHDYIDKLIQKAAPFRRVGVEWQLSSFVLDEKRSTSKMEAYREAKNRSEREASMSNLIALSHKPIAPRIFPELLQIKMRPHYVDTNSAAGLVRDNTVRLRQAQRPSVTKRQT